MVARAVAGHCNTFGDEVIALSRDEFDISDRGGALSIIKSIQPDAVVNCAAFTNVDGAETEKDACFAVNALGVENLAEACRRTDAVFVTISTDYVFDGSNRGFYTQRDTPDPLGVYGKAKREGEVRAFAAYPRSIVVRSGWIFGRGGTNFLSTIPRFLTEGKTFKAINDSYGTPTFAEDLARRLRELAGADLPGVYHVTNSGSGCSYLEFAEKSGELTGSDPELIQPASHTELQRPAPRPVSSKLACLVSEKLGFSPLRNWQDALRSFVESP